MGASYSDSIASLGVVLKEARMYKLVTLTLDTQRSQGAGPNGENPATSGPLPWGMPQGLQWFPDIGLIQQSNTNIKLAGDVELVMKGRFVNDTLRALLCPKDQVAHVMVSLQEVFSDMHPCLSFTFVHQMYFLLTDTEKTPRPFPFWSCISNHRLKIGSYLWSCQSAWTLNVSSQKRRTPAFLPSTISREQSSTYPRKWWNVYLKQPLLVTDWKRTQKDPKSIPP